ncbi:MAG: VHL beta domain-containing protein [Myxococcaceae bacterium]
MLSSWIDYDGQERNPSIVLPGTRMNVSTWETHVFRLRLGDRNRAFLRDVVAPAAVKARLVFCGCGGEGSAAVGGEAFEILDAGAEALLQPPIPECRVPFNSEPATTTASSTLSPRYGLVFRNSCIGTRVRLDWVQFDGGLRLTGELNPGEQFDQSSFVGHQWRVRDATTFRWIRDFALDGGTTVDLCSCE